MTNTFFIFFALKRTDVDTGRGLLQTTLMPQRGLRGGLGADLGGPEGPLGALREALCGLLFETRKAKTKVLPS